MSRPSYIFRESRDLHEASHSDTWKDNTFETMIIFCVVCTFIFEIAVGFMLGSDNKKQRHLESWYLILQYFVALLLGQ